MTDPTQGNKRKFKTEDLELATCQTFRCPSCMRSIWTQVPVTRSPKCPKCAYFPTTVDHGGVVPPWGEA